MWSKKSERCINCGTIEIKHRARGLCSNCYQSDIETRHKVPDRQRGIAAQLFTKDYPMENYAQKKRSLGEIAKECNCTRQYVHRMVKHYQIPARSLSEARQIALKESRISFEHQMDDGETVIITHEAQRLNHKFFSTWSSEMGYVLGAIYTDGSLDPGWVKDPSRKSSAIPRLSIGQKEPELMEKVLALMDCNAKMSHRKKQEFDYTTSGEVWYVQINVSKVYDDLINLGLIPNKSLTMQFPEIPKVYVRHFIRGCWDGDGSIFCDKSGRPVAHYVSGSLRFVEGMLEQLEDAGLPERTVHKSKYSTSYYFKFFGPQCKLLYEYLYRDVGPALYLERKQALFKRSALLYQNGSAL